MSPRNHKQFEQKKNINSSSQTFFVYKQFKQKNGEKAVMEVTVLKKRQGEAWPLLAAEQTLNETSLK